MKVLNLTILFLILLLGIGCGNPITPGGYLERLEGDWNLSYHVMGVRTYDVRDLDETDDWITLTYMLDYYDSKLVYVYNDGIAMRDSRNSDLMPVIWRYRENALYLEWTEDTELPDGLYTRRYAILVKLPPDATEGVFEGTMTETMDYFIETYEKDYLCIHEVIGWMVQ